MTNIVRLGYGDSTSGYGHAAVVFGPRGGGHVTSHDGHSRRVTHAALVQAARQVRDGQHNPGVLTTAGDDLPVWPLSQYDWERLGL